ncbi:MAG: Stress-induced bacterial acidophilic repeat motif [Flavipsychrobacter sp.]|jgi:general stress protein YciG|nr:Stress-induced bacterial acidophilic repeat motif [Flavipsychrobacter sp.]
MSENTQGNGTRENEKTPSRTSNRGFASMDPKQQREIASKGGQAAHQLGVAHEWTSEEARAAGRKGGQASRGGGRSNSSSRGENTNNTSSNINNPESKE